MIPKIIHYCWFGKGLMPKSQKDCIKSWKKIMPDYKIMRWDESNFDIDFCEFSSAAYKAKKYAFVADVARLFALNKYGGIYLDTDVEVFKKFDDYLDADFFSAIELYTEFYTENSAELLDDDGNPKVAGMEIPHLEMLTSTMGAVPANCLIKDCLDFYTNIKPNADMIANFREYVNYDRLVAKYATKYGFRYKDEKQELDNNMVIYPTGIFGHAHCPNPNFEVSYHYNAATWKDGKTAGLKRKELLDKLHLLWLYDKFKALKKR